MFGGYTMKDLIASFDKLPKILKIIFALPGLDIIWAIYRIIKGVAYKNMITLIFGILWIIPGSVICWVLDLIWTILGKDPLFTEA